MASRNTVSVVILGRVGVGKSALINTVFSLQDGRGAQTAYSGTSVTQDIQVHETQLDGTLYRLIDTPGLQDINHRPEKEEEIISCILRENANVILYCISILPSSKICEADKRVILALNQIEKIWNRTIVVLTFANMVTTMSGDTNSIILRWTHDFQNILREAQIYNVAVKSFVEARADPSFAGIVTIPAGLRPSDKLPHSNNWIETLLEEIHKKQLVRYPQLKQKVGLKRKLDMSHYYLLAIIVVLFGMPIAFIFYGIEGVILLCIVFGVLVFTAVYGLRRYQGSRYKKVQYP